MKYYINDRSSGFSGIISGNNKLEIINKLIKILSEQDKLFLDDLIERLDVDMEISLDDITNIKEY